MDQSTPPILPQTNFLGRNFVPGRTPEPPVVPDTDIELGHTDHTKLYIGIILFLLFTNIAAFVFIIVLATQMPYLAKPDLLTTQSPSQSLLTTDSGISGPVSTQVSGLQQAVAQKMAAVDQNPGSNMYTKSLDMANDTKRKADLVQLGTIMNIYMTENDVLPPNFPDQPKCIGTGILCFDLYKILVPQYMDAPIIDQKHGTQADTGYLIGTSHDGNTTFILQATNDTGEIIELKK